MGDNSVDFPDVPEVPSAEHTDKGPGDRLGFLWDVHKYFNQYIGFSDSRATTTTIVSTSLIGALYQTKVHQAFAGETPGQWLRLDTLAAVAAFVFLAMGILFCIMTIIPRLKKTPAAGYVYWESVLQHGSAEKFWQRLHGISTHDLAEQMAGTVYVLASISTRKYTLLRRGMLSSFIGGMLGALVLIFR